MNRIISGKEIMELAKSRPDMACIFQVPEKHYPRFTVYKTYVACYSLNHLTSYNTTELKDDIIKLEPTDVNLNKKLEELGFDPEDNVIYAFLIENDAAI